jgi:predicted secreted protein
MTWASAIVVYVIIWWLVFFMTLPFGVRAAHEAGEEVQPGNDAGAPVKPMLGTKMAITTLIAGALWGVAYWLIASDLISFRDG